MPFLIPGEVFKIISKKNTTNPRYANGTLRRKNRARLKATGAPCHICGKPIHYDEPSDYRHPLSFVIDEIIPVSQWQEFGYSSPRAVAEDYNNLACAHYICNHLKSNKVADDRKIIKKINLIDGDW